MRASNRLQNLQVGQLRPSRGRGKAHRVGAVLPHPWVPAQLTMEQQSLGNRAQVAIQYSQETHHPDALHAGARSFAWTGDLDCQAPADEGTTTGFPQITGVPYEFQSCCHELGLQILATYMCNHEMMPSTLLKSCCMRSGGTTTVGPETVTTLARTRPWDNAASTSGYGGGGGYGTTYGAGGYGTGGGYGSSYGGYGAGDFPVTDA